MASINTLKLPDEKIVPLAVIAIRCGADGHSLELLSCPDGELIAAVAEHYDLEIKTVMSELNDILTRGKRATPAKPRKRGAA